MKVKWFKRMLAFSLATAVLFTGSVPMSHNLVQVQAASVYENENLLVNPDFDGSEEFQPAGGIPCGQLVCLGGTSKNAGRISLGYYFCKITTDRCCFGTGCAGIGRGYDL